MTDLEVGDIVPCFVERIEKTIIFVKIRYRGKELEGSIVTSEIAPGRIRNIRDYVVPKKTIVCKVLRISGDRIDLSLRRVTQKEKKELLEESKQSKSYQSILKSVIGKDAEKVIKEIREKESIYNFFQEAKESPKELEKLLGKTESKKVLEILKSQKSKKVSVKKEFSLKTSEPNGLELIKNLLSNITDAEINYISAGKYSIKSESEEAKKADNLIRGIMEDLAEKAKKSNMELEIKAK